MAPAPYPEPVVVLPGITGSSLRDAYTVPPEEIFTLLAKQYERLALHPGDLRYELREPALVASDHPLLVPYRDFLAELRHSLTQKVDEPVPVYPFAYDWRQPLAATEARLADFLDEAIARTRLLPHYHAAGYGGAAWPARVQLVGHSMGGLVIAGYLAGAGSAKVARVATLGTPFRGSHEAPRQVITGQGDLGTVAPQPREREAARVTPALYHLLPDYDGAVVAQDGLTPDLFAAGNWQSAPVRTIAEYLRLYGPDRSDPAGRAPAIFQAMLDQARAHRRAVEGLSLAGGLGEEGWLAIVGVGEDTWVRLTIRREPDPATRQPAVRFDFDRKQDLGRGWSTKPSQRTRRTGDGTVPFAGACPSFLGEERLVCVCRDDFGTWELGDRLLEGVAGLHALLPKMNLVQRLVVSHLQGRMEGPPGSLWGRPAPGVKPAEWRPPVAGLRAK